MNRRIVLPVVLALVLGVVLATGALAQSATPPAQGQAPNTTTPSTPVPGKGFGLGMRGGWFGWGAEGKNNWTEFDAAAKALNLSPTEFFDQLHSGKTLSEIAQARNVDINTVQQAVQAARVQAQKDAINQAVRDGRITQDQADWLIQGLDKGWMGGHGFGRFGRGMRAPGNSQQPSTQPGATPSA